MNSGFYSLSVLWEGIIMMVKLISLSLCPYNLLHTEDEYRKRDEKIIIMIDVKLLIINVIAM